MYNIKFLAASARRAAGRVLSIAVLMILAAKTASAALIGIDFYFDLDSNATTGCSVTALSKTIAGFERKVSVVYDDATQTVSSATSAQCVSSVLQAPSTLNTSGWSVVTDPSNPAQDVLSGLLPASMFPTQPAGVIVTSADGGTVVDVLDGGNAGFASLAGLTAASTATPIPTLDFYGMVMLIIAIMGISWYLSRRQGFPGKHNNLQNFFAVVLLGALLSGTSGNAEAASSVVVTEPSSQAASELSSIPRADVLSSEFQKNGNGDIGVRVVIRKAAPVGTFEFSRPSNENTVLNPCSPRFTPPLWV